MSPTLILLVVVAPIVGLLCFGLGFCAAHATSLRMIGDAVRSASTTPSSSSSSRNGRGRQRGGGDVEADGSDGDEPPLRDRRRSRVSAYDVRPRVDAVDRDHHALDRHRRPTSRPSSGSSRRDAPARSATPAATPSSRTIDAGGDRRAPSSSVSLSSSRSAANVADQLMMRGDASRAPPAASDRHDGRYGPASDSDDDDDDDVQDGR